MEELFGIDYSCYSPLTDGDDTTYINEINGSILVFDKDDNFKELAGKFKAAYLSLQLASEEDYFVADLFESEEILKAIGDSIYDYESNFFNKKIREFYRNKILNENILVIQSMEIIEKYRNRRLGAMAIKDLINRFGVNCGLVTIRLFPMQHDDTMIRNAENKKWLGKLKLENLEKDEEQAFYKLAAYYQSLGFSNIDGDDIFTLNPAEKSMDHIRLQFF